MRDTVFVWPGVVAVVTRVAPSTPPRACGDAVIGVTLGGPAEPLAGTPAAGDAPYLALFVDALARGVAQAGLVTPPGAVIDAAVVGRPDGPCDRAWIAHAAGTLVRWLVHAGASRRIDRRVRRVLDELRASVQAATVTEQPPTAASAAAHADRTGLSERHLARLFRTQTTMTVAAYRTWLRVRHGAAQILGGRTITDAAAEAGFADGAHFARAVRAALGVAPSAIASMTRVVGDSRDLA